MKMSKVGLAAVAWMLAAAACSSPSSTQLTPIGDGGSSAAAGSADMGSSGAGGSADMGSSGASGSPAAGGQGGSTEGGVDAGAVQFQAALHGDTISLNASGGVWLEACDRDNPRVIEQVDGGWVALRDERPYAFNLQFASHYLDGVYKTGCGLSLGCDVAYCYRLGQNDDPYASLQLVGREYVQVGERAALACDAGAGLNDAGALDAGLDGGTDAGVERVPDIESRAPSGQLRVRIRYFGADHCSGEATTADVDVLPNAP